MYVIYVIENSKNTHCIIISSGHPKNMTRWVDDIISLKHSWYKVVLNTPREIMNLFLIHRLITYCWIYVQDVWTRVNSVMSWEDILLLYWLYSPIQIYNCLQKGFQEKLASDILCLKLCMCMKDSSRQLDLSRSRYQVGFLYN